MEVSLVSTPTQKAQITPPAPPNRSRQNLNRRKNNPSKSRSRKKRRLFLSRRNCRNRRLLLKKSLRLQSAPTPPVSAPQPVSRPAPAVVSTNRESAPASFRWNAFRRNILRGRLVGISKVGLKSSLLLHHGATLKMP